MKLALGKVQIKMAASFVLLFSLTSPSLAQDQLDMNEQACQSYKKSDTRLNQIYAKVLKQYATNSNFTSKLRTAERAWISFRDQQLRALYPDDNPDTQGSNSTMCHCLALDDLTTQRIQDLQFLAIQNKISASAAVSDFRTTDTEVDRIYKAALKIPHPYEVPSFWTKFRQSQQSWLKFRSAEEDALQALATPTKYNHLIKLNKARAKSLTDWTKGIEEGDVCAGSRVIR